MITGVYDSLRPKTVDFRVADAGLALLYCRDSRRCANMDLMIEGLPLQTALRSDQTTVEPGTCASFVT